MKFTIYNLQFTKKRFGKWKIQKGISLIEILITVTIFAALGILITRSVALTLQSSKKSEAVVAVRENLDYSINVIERQIRNANSISCTSSLVLAYTDQNNNASSFSCVGAVQNYSVASGSAMLTSIAIVKITACSFTCGLGTSVNQPHVDVTLTGQSTTLTGSQSSPETVSTRIYLRNY